MKHLRFLVFGLVALVAAGSFGCAHPCGCPGTEQRGYFSPCNTCAPPPPVTPACPPPGAPTFR